MTVLIGAVILSVGILIGVAITAGYAKGAERRGWLRCWNQVKGLFPKDAKEDEK